jgi:molybdenum cofactor guanylyltransferase
MADPSFPSHQIAAVVLAGGDGKRLGLGTKALVPVKGTALIDRTLASLRPQTSHIGINVRVANDWARARGFPVICDTLSDVGPLAGVLAALTWAQDNVKAEFVLTTPTDCPFLPADLAARLFSAMTDHIDVVVAESDGRTHHVVGLWRTRLRQRLAEELQRQGAVSIHRFQAQCRTTAVSWPVDSCDPFFNINTQDDLAKAEALAQ